MKLRQLVLVTLILFAIPLASLGQTAVVSGNLFGFDVLNDTGQPAHGFEIQIEGALPGDLYYTFPGGRYGSPTIVPYASGVYIRWQAVYFANTGTYSTATPPANAQTFSWQDCYQGGLGYPTSGCEHLGQGMRSTSTAFVVTGRWLVDNPASPGQLIAVNPPAAIPFPVWNVAPPATTPSAPIVVVKVTPPPPPPAKYGDAYWIKVFKTDQNRSVGGDELLSTNPAVVPEDSTQVETPWKLLQSPPPGANGNHGLHSAQSEIGRAHV